MKKLLFLLLFLPVVALAQKPDISPLQWEGDQMTHQTVIDLPSMSQSQIFTGVKSFLIDTYKDYEKVVQVEEKEMGVISGRGSTSIAYKTFPSGIWDTFYNFKFEIKEEKLRITYSSLEAMTTGITPLEVYTKNALSGKYLNKLQGAAKDVIPGLGMNFEELNHRLVESFKKSQDW